MTNKNIYMNLGGLDPELIMKAAPAEKVQKKKSRTWVKWTSIAACLAIFVMVGALTLPTLMGDSITIGGIDRNYGTGISGSEGGFIFPWEYMTTTEKYTLVKYDGKEYRTRSRTIDEDLLDSVIGTCTAKGTDVYTDKTYSDTFEVRKIKGVSEDMIVAVSMDGGHYVYANIKAKQPSTFGELLDAYNLSQTLPLNKFSVNEGNKEKGYYQITDDAYIWQILSECRDAKPYEDADNWRTKDRNYLSFTATSDVLGVYKRVFYVTEDGYISTNVFDYGYVYFIGVEKANSIISYAMNNASKTEREPYEYTIAGTITEIGDGYILIDDTILCKNKNDGMVFKILTEEFQIKRYLEVREFKVGDTVVVKFQNEIVLGENNTVDGAVSMYKGKVSNGGLSVPE